MRKIQFRGKCKDNNEWVIGGYYPLYPNHIIVVDHRVLGEADRVNHYEVVPETVGQFTGLTDKNGKEIYEGDILYMWNTGMKKAIVKFTHGTFALFVEDDKYLQPLNLQYWLDSEIIGNIHDNPELFKKEKTNVKQQICYKTNEPCPYDCKGLCKDSM